jgi:hypothetical protein
MSETVTERFEMKLGNIEVTLWRLESSWNKIQIDIGGKDLQLNLNASVEDFRTFAKLILTLGELKDDRDVLTRLVGPEIRQQLLDNKEFQSEKWKLIEEDNR